MFMVLASQGFPDAQLIRFWYIYIYEAYVCINHPGTTFNLGWRHLAPRRLSIRKFSRWHQVGL